MRYVIDHLRSSPLKLIDLKPEASKDLGPYQTIGVQLTLEGKFAEIDAFLGWVESAERPLRVDSIKIDPDQKKVGGLKAQLTLLGLAEKTPTAAKEKPEANKGQPASNYEIGLADENAALVNRSPTLIVVGLLSYAGYSVSASVADLDPSRRGRHERTECHDQRCPRLE